MKIIEKLYEGEGFEFLFRKSKWIHLNRLNALIPVIILKN